MSLSFLHRATVRSTLPWTLPHEAMTCTKKKRRTKKMRWKDETAIAGIAWIGAVARRKKENDPPAEARAAGSTAPPRPMTVRT